MNPYPIDVKLRLDNYAATYRFLINPNQSPAASKISQILATFREIKVSRFDLARMKNVVLESPISDWDNNCAVGLKHPVGESLNI